MSLCVRGLFIVVIAECGNRCVRGDGLLLESVLLTSVHICTDTNSIILCSVAYYTCMFVILTSQTGPKFHGVFDWFVPPLFPT